jgi:hypothetical protein
MTFSTRTNFAIMVTLAEGLTRRAGVAAAEQRKVDADGVEGAGALAALMGAALRLCRFRRQYRLKWQKNAGRCSPRNFSARARQPRRQHRGSAPINRPFQQGVANGGNMEDKPAK